MINLERQKAIEEIPVLVSKLQRIVMRLEELFPGRHFTLDGHLVGSIAEVIASYMMTLSFYPVPNSATTVSVAESESMSR